jgi:hypothetical protein
LQVIGKLTELAGNRTLQPVDEMAICRQGTIRRRVCGRQLFGNPFTLYLLSYTFLFISIVYAVYRYSGDESRRQGAIEQEFKSAQELQRVLIPETLPPLPGFAVTSAYRPAQEVAATSSSSSQNPKVPLSSSSATSAAKASKRP